MAQQCNCAIHIYIDHVMLWGRCFQVCAAFSQVSFTEKTQQGRQTLQRDFPGSCTFQDVLHVLPDTLQANLSKESTMTSVPYKTHAYCHTHSGSCSLPCNAHLALFGAPCVDDSTIGSHRTDNGPARQVPLNFLSSTSFPLCSHTCIYKYLYIGVCVYIYTHSASPCHVICAQETMPYLRYLEQRAKPQICISENVVTGNIGQRVCETFSKSMTSQASQLSTELVIVVL